VSDVRDYLEEELRRTLATDPRVLEPELDIAIEGDHVVVSGVVPTEARRAVVQEVLEERVGHGRVVNRTEVATFPPPTTEEPVR
jgi:BON domain-containing protein